MCSVHRACCAAACRFPPPLTKPPLRVCVCVDASAIYLPLTFVPSLEVGRDTLLVLRWGRVMCAYACVLS